MDYFPKMIQVNGYEKALTSLVRDYASFGNTAQSSSDTYFYSELYESVNHAIETIRARPPVNEVIDAIESVWDTFQEWSDFTETNVMHTEAWARSALMPDYPALVKISEDIFGVHQNSFIDSDGVFDLELLEPKEKAFFRHAPLGGLDCARCFPQFDALLGTNGNCALSAEYLPIYSVVYCNAPLMAHKHD